MHTRKSMLAFALATLLGLGACGTATTQGQDKTGVPAKVSTVVDASTQSIHLEGVGNARQLGGYVGEGGRTVKDGVLLRIAALSKATEEDVRRLTEEYHLAEVIDLRLASEVESDPELKIDGVKNLNLRIIDEEALAKIFKVRSIPTLVYIPKGGDVPTVQAGGKSKAELKELIDNMLLK
jgi:hypothetical protein